MLQTPRERWVLTREAQVRLVEEVNSLLKEGFLEVRFARLLDQVEQARTYGDPTSIGLPPSWTRSGKVEFVLFYSTDFVTV